MTTATREYQITYWTRLKNLYEFLRKWDDVAFANYKINQAMGTVTPQQAKETYERTVRDEDRNNWPNWILAVSNSLAAGEWMGGDMFPDYAEKVFEAVNASAKVSMADEKDRP